MARRRKRLTFISIFGYWILLVDLLIGLIGGVNTAAGRGHANGEVMALGFRIVSSPLFVGDANLILSLFGGLTRIVLDQFRVRAVTLRCGSHSNPNTGNQNQSSASDSESEKR